MVRFQRMNFWKYFVRDYQGTNNKMSSLNNEQTEILDFLRNMLNNTR